MSTRTISRYNLLLVRNFIRISHTDFTWELINYLIQKPLSSELDAMILNKRINSGGILKETNDKKIRGPT